MKRYFCRLSYAWFLLAMPFLLAMSVAASTSRIYVTNSASDSIDVIDPVTNKVVQTITGVPSPNGASFSPDGSRAYITSETSEHNLYVVDTTTGKTLNKVVLSGRPSMVTTTKDGGRLFILIEDPGPAVPIADAPFQRGHSDNSNNRAGTNGGNVDIVDTTTLRVKKTLQISRPGVGMLHDLGLSPDGKYVAFGCCEGRREANLGFLAVIDVQNEQVAWEVPTDMNVLPIAVEANPDGLTRRIFMGIHGLRGFAAVDFETHDVTKIALPKEPTGFMTAGSTLTHNHGLEITPDGKTLWVNSCNANSVFAYSLPELKLLGHAALPTNLKGAGDPAHGNGSRPEWITFTPDSKTGYVSMTALAEVAAIDVKTLKVVAVIPVGQRLDSFFHVFTLVKP